MDISNFFISSSEKRDLSDQSCNGEEPKKAREGSLNDSSVPLDDVFTEDMKSPDYFHILVNRMQSIEAKTKEIFEMNQVTQDNQIKGECQLGDLVKSLEFYNEKFEDLERDNRKKEKKINELEETTRKMDQKINDLNRVIDRHEPYYRRNCILVHGVKESENEDNDVVVAETLNELLQEKLTDVDIGRSHWIRKLKKGKQSRPIIIKFARYSIRNRVFKNKKKLKNTGTSITDSLTQKRMHTNAYHAYQSKKRVFIQKCLDTGWKNFS